MKKLFLFLAGLLPFTCSGLTFTGDIIGTWTTGNDEYNIHPGDQFAWQYIYEADVKNGSFSSHDGTLIDVIKYDLPGTRTWDLRPDCSMIITDGVITSAAFSWQMEFTTLPGVGLFRLQLDEVHPEGNFGLLFTTGSLHFTNPEEIVVRQGDPIDAPDTGSTALLFLISASLLWAVPHAKSFRPRATKKSLPGNC
jgi:hypothetical protein